METEAMDLDIIVNPKMTDDGQAVIQVDCNLFVFATLLNMVHSLKLLQVLPSSTLGMRTVSTFLASVSSLSRVAPTFY